VKVPQNLTGSSIQEVPGSNLQLPRKELLQERIMTGWIGINRIASGKRLGGNRLGRERIRAQRAVLLKRGGDLNPQSQLGLVKMRGTLVVKSVQRAAPNPAKRRIAQAARGTAAIATDIQSRGCMNNGRLLLVARRTNLPTKDPRESMRKKNRAETRRIAHRNKFHESFPRG